MTKIDDFEIVKHHDQYLVRNWKLNTVIDFFKDYQTAYQAVMKILYTQRNK